MIIKKCVGRPLGWVGGDVKFCEAEIEIGTRFCYRCHIVAIGEAANRVKGLQLQLLKAQVELNNLLEDSMAS